MNYINYVIILCNHHEHFKRINETGYSKLTEYKSCIENYGIDEGKQKRTSFMLSVVQHNVLESPTPSLPSFNSLVHLETVHIKELVLFLF